MTRTTSSCRGLKASGVWIHLYLETAFDHLQHTQSWCLGWRQEALQLENFHQHQKNLPHLKLILKLVNNDIAGDLNQLCDQKFIKPNSKCFPPPYSKWKPCPSCSRVSWELEFVQSQQTGWRAAPGKHHTFGQGANQSNNNMSEVSHEPFCVIIHHLMQVGNKPQHLQQADPFPTETQCTVIISKAVAALHEVFHLRSVPPVHNSLSFQRFRSKTIQGWWLLWVSIEETFATTMSNVLSVSAAD